jgi:hypothetical protein
MHQTPSVCKATVAESSHIMAQNERREFFEMLGSMDWMHWA